MNALRHHYSLTRALLLAVVLLAAQSLLLWHTHDDAGHATDAACELCVHAQHHTPAPAANPLQLYASYVLAEVREPVVPATYEVDSSLTYHSRAPPNSLFS